MEPETHRLDREAMLAARRGAAERVGRETDEIVAAAAEKRRAFLDRAIAQMRADDAWELERERIVSVLLATGDSSSAAPPRTRVAISAIVSVESEGQDVTELPLARAATG